MSIVPVLVNSSSPPAAPAYGCWQDAFRDAVRDPAELCRLVGLPREYAVRAARATGDFPLFAPRAYIARMRVGDPADPLLRQVLPLDDEMTSPAGFTADPVGDLTARQRPRLLHKYRGRVLLVATGICAVHCRYCFRRHFPYSDDQQGTSDWRPALDYIQAEPTIHEVILSGGDPLTLADARLAELVEQLAAVPHVRRLRVHTRLPIVIPERVTGELVALLRGTRLTPIVVVHVNHANELDAATAAAIARLADGGIPLLNQSVLLRGVNDDVDALAALSERLVELRVLPYYLHQLDRVAGAAHFEVSAARGKALVRRLRKRLSGYAVPRYVREVPGRSHKVALL